MCVPAGGGDECSPLCPPPPSPHGNAWAMLGHGRGHGRTDGGGLVLWIVLGYPSNSNF